MYRCTMVYFIPWYAMVRLYHVVLPYPKNHMVYRWLILWYYRGLFLMGGLGQSYDGAGSMSGKYQGLRTDISELQPKACVQLV